jgi:hypothetical protein
MISCILLAPAETAPYSARDVERIVRDLHGAQLFDISLVAGAGEIRTAAQLLPVKLVEPEHATDLRNIVGGLEALPRGELSGVLVWPLDAGVRSTTFLVHFFHEFYKSRSRIILPEHGDRPVIIDACLLDAMRSASPQSTLRTFLDDHAGDLRRVERMEP